MHQRFTRRTVLATALASPFVLASCGSAASSFGPGGGRRVSIMLNWYPYGEHCPFYYGVEQGIFADHDLDLRISPGQGAAKTAQAIGVGEAEFGWADTPVVLGNIDNGVDIKSVGVFLQTTPSAVQYFAESGITDPSDLLGRTIAMSAGDAPSTTFPLFLEAAGLDGEEMVQQNIDPAGKNSALLSGQVDALVGFAHDQSPIIAETSGKEMASISYADVGLNFFSNGLITSGDVLAEDHDLVQAMVDATSDAFTAAMENPEAAVAAMRGRDPQIAEVHVLLEQWQGTVELLRTENNPDGAPGSNTTADWQNTIAVLTEAGILESGGTTDTYFDARFAPSN